MILAKEDLFLQAPNYTRHWHQARAVADIEDLAPLPAFPLMYAATAQLDNARQGYRIALDQVGWLWTKTTIRCHRPLDPALCGALDNALGQVLGGVTGSKEMI